MSPWLYSAGLGLVGSRADRLELGIHYRVQASTSGLLDQTGSAVFKLKL